MRTARFMELCLLYLGAVLFAQFAFVMQFRLTVYSIVPLFGSLAFFLIALESRQDGDETVWPSKVVYVASLFAVTYTVWVIGQFLSAYSLI